MWPWCDQAAGSGKKRGRSQVPEELSISHSHGKQAQTLPLPRAAWRRERHPPRAWDSCTGEEHRLCEGNCWPSWKMGMCPKVIRPHTQKVLFVRKLPQAIFCSPYARCVLESEFSGGNRQLLAQSELHNKVLWDIRAYNECWRYLWILLNWNGTTAWRTTLLSLLHWRINHACLALWPFPPRKLAI